MFDELKPILLILVIISAVSTVRADDLQMHDLRFFLDPNLVVGMDSNELKSNLSQYAEDINNIFAKQTVRRMVFDPDTGIIIASTRPYSDSWFNPLPDQGYELWVHAVLTDVPGVSYGGSARADVNGARVASHLKWDSIHNPSALADGSRALEEYWFQITAIVHEFGHAFGAGYSEYYNLNYVDDMTGVEPIVDIDLDPTNAYWNKHQDYFTDPMEGSIYGSPLVGSPTELQELRNKVAFADVTVSVVNLKSTRITPEMSTLPYLPATKVEVLDARTRERVSAGTVRVWQVNGISYENEELAVVPDVNEGTYEFYWDPNNAFNTSGHLKLVKAFAPDYEAEAVWFSVFDAVEDKMVYGRNELVIRVYLMPAAGTYLVNMLDFAMLAAAWLSEDDQERFDCRIDLYSDGVIDWNDMQILASYWLNDLPGD